MNVSTALVFVVALAALFYFKSKLIIPLVTSRAQHSQVTVRALSQPDEIKRANPWRASSESCRTEMETDMNGMTIAQLLKALTSATPPLVIDVRRREVYSKDTKTIAGALRRDPEQVSAWVRELPSAETVVVACVHGHEVSQGAARALSSQLGRSPGIFPRGWHRGLGSLGRSVRFQAAATDPAQ